MPSSKPLYNIFGVYIPLSILILWSIMLGTALRSIAPPGSIIFPFDEKIWCLTGFLSILAASGYAMAMKKSHFAHTAADFRGSIILVFITYLLASLFRRELPFAKRFMPCTDSVVSALAALTAWFSVIFLLEIFNGLELFESFKTQNRGEQLREVMREFSPEMSQTDRNLKKLMRNYGIEIILPCLVMSFIFFNAELKSLHFVILIVIVFIIFTAGFLILGFFRLLRRELTFASEGISLAIRDRAMPLPVMGIGILTASILAVLASSDASLLPPEIITGFLVWLLRLLSSLFRKTDPQGYVMPNEIIMPLDGGLAEFFPASETAGPWAGWRYIKYGLIVLLVFFFLLFMIYPLLKRSRLFPGFAFIRTAVKKWLNELGKGIRSFLNALFDRGSSQKYKEDNEKLNRIKSELLTGNLKRKEIKRSVNLFARLILWGIEVMGVPWKPVHAPGEYCVLLAGANGVIEKSEKIIRCGELFEKALYSKQSLTAVEEKEFKVKVEGILLG